MTAVPADIFKAYDIRGLYGSEIDGDLAERIGRAFAHVLAGLAGKPAGKLRVGLGRDMRLTAPELAARYREGLLATGASVIDAGQVGSEMLYYLVGSRELDGGLMCTASHNPKAYTGAKLLREGALALSGDSGIQDIRREVEAETAAAAGGAGARGTLEEADLYAEFKDVALGFVDADAIRSAPRRLKVVLDGGNGMAGPMVGPVLESLNLELIETYWTPDGNFPDHEPNPLLPENRQLIIEQVRASGADLGIAWDGDADRCFFIDDTGAFVDGDFLTALLAESLLEKHPAEAILYDVRASRAVPDTVRRAGGTPYVNRVGHAFFKTRMRKEGSLFGGEVSGHYYFRDFYCADSGTLPALLMLELLCTRGKRMSELLAPYHAKYFISGEVNSEVSDPAAKMEELAAHYADARQERLDGISIDYEDWHFNVRPSNTEPLLRLCLESLVSREDMQRRRDEVLALIRSPSGGCVSEAEDPQKRAEREALALAAGAGIHRLAIPTPFMVGRVNAYLIEDSPLTLVDSGPNSAKALDELEQALAARGHRIEDIELLVISHQHMDHFGLASILARRSGAEVAALAPLAPFLAGYAHQTDLEDRFAERLMLRHGIPPEIVTALRAVSAGFRAWGSAVEVTRLLSDGSTLELRDRTLRVLHRPGHSPSDTIFLDDRSKIGQPSILLAADHLIAHISSNPLISRPLDAGEDYYEPRPQALITYMASLEQTRAMDLELVLPGHGRPITDHVALIDERFRLHRRRAEKMLGLISSQPRTAHGIAQELWGNVAVTQAFLTLSEVLGHVDLLLRDGRVVEDERDGVVHFVAA